jgi:hypothetical protein
MATTTLGSEWAYLYFEIAQAADRGVEMSVQEAENAARDGYVTDVLERYYEIDLGLLDDDERAIIDQAYQEHAVEPDRLGLRNNGLQYLAGLVITILRHGEWHDPDTGQPVNTDRLQFK